MPTTTEEYIVEMLWDCPNKHSRQLGRHLNCQICGYRKKEDQAYYNPDDISTDNKVVGELHEKNANAGPNWSCKYCGCTTRNLSGQCSYCGGEKPESKKTKEAPESNDGLEQDIPDPPVTPKRWLHGLAVIAFVMCIIGVIWSATRPVIGVLTASEIMCRQTEQLLKEEAASGFQAPSDAYDIQSDGLKFHHNEKRRTGSHIEHYSERESCGQTCVPVPVRCSTTPRSCSNQCTSAKNGYAKCTKTCSGGDRVCSGGGQSCSTKYCNVEKTRTVNDYVNVPIMLESFRWKQLVWRTQQELSTPMQSCTSVCSNEYQTNTRKVESKIMQRATMKVNDSTESYTLRTCQNLTVGTTYSVKGFGVYSLEPMH